jgi:Helix-turn-helix domain
VRQIEARPSLKFVDEYEAADILRVAPQTMRNWRVTGRGPAYHKFESAVRYEMGDLFSYARSRRRTSTSVEAA